MKGRVIPLVCLALTGSVMAGIASWKITNQDGHEKITHLNVLERYEQRLPCFADTHVITHALVAFKPVYPRDIIQDITRLHINDPANNVQVDIEVSPERGDYYFHNLFHKREHHEQWREFCHGWFCKTSVNFYANEYPHSIIHRPVGISAYHNEKELTSDWVDIQPPTREQAQSFSYPALDAHLVNGNIEATFPATKAGQVIVFQERDHMGNYHESLTSIEKDGDHSKMVYHLKDGEKSLYGSVFIYGMDKNLSAENKIELLNSQACMDETRWRKK